MDPIIEHDLDDDIFSNDVQYFFTFLSNRFDLINKRVESLLEKRFGKTFKPIYILKSPPNKYFKKENFIVLNERLAECRETLKSKNLILDGMYSELNEEFSDSVFVKDLIRKIGLKQERIFIMPYTTSFLEIKDPKVVILGPDPKVATKYDNKIEQARLFDRLDLPMADFIVYEDLDALKEDVERLAPFFVSARYTAGGAEHMLVEDLEDLEEFGNKLSLINEDGGLRVSDIVDDIEMSPAVNAIVTGKNKTDVIVIMDQMIKEHKYLGTVYPSKIDKKHVKMIIEATKKIGNALSQEGFRGFFGCDFLIDDDDKICVIDLNPRRTGSYACTCFMSKKVDIVDCELRLALGEKLPKFSYEDVQVDYAFAQKKIAPSHVFGEIVGEVKVSEMDMPFKKTGEAFVCTFYPKGHTWIGGNELGYCVASGKDYWKVMRRVGELSEKTLARVLKEYHVAEVD